MRPKIHSIVAVSAIVLSVFALALAADKTEASPETGGKAILKGSVDSLTGGRMAGTVVRVTDLHDSEMAPIADIEVHPETGMYEYAFNISGTYQAFATALSFHHSEVFTVDLIPGEVTWLNVTLVRIEQITVTVSAEDGPLEGASVTLKPWDGNELTVTTPQSGLNKVFVTGAGSYNISVSKVGFETQTMDLDVGPGEWIALNFTLKEIEAGSEPLDPMFVYLGAGLGLLILLGCAAGIAMIVSRNRKKIPPKEDAITDMDCPKCGKAVSSSLTACPHCGELFKIRCPQCGKEYNERVSGCEECGYVLQAMGDQDSNVVT